MTTITETHWAQLITLKTKRNGLPQLLFTVHSWEEVEDTDKDVPATLTLYECDTRYQGPSEVAAIARFSLKLRRKRNPQGNQPRVQVVSAGWKRDRRFRGRRFAGHAVPTLKSNFEQFRPEWVACEISFDGKGRKRHQVACLDFSDITGFRSEGTSFEIGFVLEVQGRKFERVGEAGEQLAHVKVKKNWLETMRKLPKRFDDPKRDKAVEQDGRPILHFMNRRQRLLLTRVFADKVGKRGVERDQVGDSDIAKAFFVVHDVGNKHTKVINRPTRTVDKLSVWYKENNAETRAFEMPVHGFLNPDGTYVSICDFAALRYGTKLEGRSAGKPWRGYCIHIECVPGVLPISNREAIRLAELRPSKRDDNPAWVLAGKASELRKRGAKILQYFEDHYTQAKQVVDGGGHLGWALKRAKKNVYQAYAVLWPKALMERLADLYCYASYRSGHLLTVTCHVEVDRSLKGGHNDPRGMDMQDLYDRITTRLKPYQSPGFGTPLTKGMRYGIHPDRIRVNDKAKGNYGEALGNLGDERHVWPHQSRAKALKAPKA